MFERSVNLEIGEAYTTLKATLVEMDCKVLSEQPPRQINVKQGSLWGISPKTAKKTIKVNFEPADSGTRVVVSSVLASDWKNITLVGCVLAAFLVGVCLWMASDLAAVLATHESSFWSWLITVGSSMDLQAGRAFVNLTFGLAIFLSAIILIEITIVAYAYSRIDELAKKALNKLS